MMAAGKGHWLTLGNGRAPFPDPTPAQCAAYYAMLSDEFRRRDNWPRTPSEASTYRAVVAMLTATKE